MQKIIFIMVIAVFLFLEKDICFAAQNDTAADTNNEDLHTVTEQMLAVYDTDKLERQIFEIFSGQNISFTQMFQNTLKSGQPFSLFVIYNAFKDAVLFQLNDLRQTISGVLLLGLFAAIFTNLSAAFGNGKVAEIGFFIIYLAMTALTLKCFVSAYESSSFVTENIVTLIKVLIPSFLLSVGMTGAITVAPLYYQLILYIVYAVESVLIGILLPLIYVYAYMVVIDGLTEGERLKGMTEFLKGAIGNICKLSISAVTGISILQAMAVPVTDALKNTALQKAAAAIPGFGGATDAGTQVIVGAAVIIKNSLGLVSIMLLILIILLPLAKILTLGVVLNLCGALISPISDKRIQKSVSGIGSALTLLAKSLITSASLFMIVIATVSIATNRGY